MKTEEDIVIEKLVGQLVAQGLSDTEILIRLEENDIEDGARRLRTFYNTWTETQEQMQTTTTDRINWHLYMRHSLLQKALKNENNKLALNVLDSMATIQGILSTVKITETPVQIIFEPQKEQPPVPMGSKKE